MKLSDNLKAFLATIAHSEGTDNGRQRTNNHGYDVVVGGSLFTDYADHPRKLVRLKSLGISSTAAGRYQILQRYYDHYKQQLRLPDFSPASQDRIAIQLIRECGAYADIQEGRIETAIRKCRSRWASFPGASYGQHEYSMESLLDVFRSKLG